ncbi:MAG: tetratricopeptide repeat protein [Flavobacteriales bacterium]|nr:tetratricopeptide repeat protein [Flavobacteriales bacterium]
MKQLAFLILTFLIAACTQPKSPPAESEPAPIEDNQELVEIYKNDQGDRQPAEIDWSVVSSRDSARRARVLDMLEEGLVRTSKDYQNAAMVFQHGGDSTSYGMAVKLMEESIELDPEANKWLLAAATDRYLLSIGKLQIYGTQYHRIKDEPWQLSEMDTTQITDAQRKEYGVETLAEQKEKVKQLNRKDLSLLLFEEVSTEDIIALIQSQVGTDSEYDVSEEGINMLGYTLMLQEKDEDALHIFKLNTELFPEGFNTYDSYGECLLKLGRTGEGVAAYRRSLELNPGNGNAAGVIEGLGG